MISNTSIRSASMKRTGAAQGETSRAYKYERLMQVTIRNNYYNASRNLCPDFEIRPTSASTDFMLSFGLVFKAERTGFSILLDSLRAEAFTSYLQATAQHPQSPPDGEQPGIWTRLSFTLTVNNPDFVNFTDLPINISPATETFYLSNAEASVTPDDTVILVPRTAKDPTLLPLTGSQYRMDVQGPGTRRVLVRDISGQIVICQPVYWPKSGTETPHCTPENAVPVFANPLELVRRNPIYLDFSLLPEDKYVIQECTDAQGDCSRMPPLSSLSSADEVVYVYSSQPMFFLDLLFTNPGIPDGVYPVEYSEDGKGTIVPRQYFLDLRRRSTVWNYYIVSTSASLDHLRIATIAPPDSPITFTGPSAVELPYNQPAALFVSNTAIPLQQQSEYSFQLQGRAGGVETRSGVLMNRLPVASAQQVFPGCGNFATREPGSTTLPADLEPGTIFSDIYVYV